MDANIEAAIERLESGLDLIELRCVLEPKEPVRLARDASLSGGRVPRASMGSNRLRSSSNK
jgi:hypothetical protein